MRLFKDKNKEKLATAIHDAEIWYNAKMLNLETRKDLQTAVEKAEHKQEFIELDKFYAKELKRVRKYSRLLGYSEKEVNEIVQDIRYPDGKPGRRSELNYKELSDEGYEIIDF